MAHVTPEFVVGDTVYAAPGAELAQKESGGYRGYVESLETDNGDDIVIRWLGAPWGFTYSFEDIVLREEF